MSEFEYLAVLVSLVLGLGLTHLLLGVARMIHRRGRFRMDPAHTLWTAAIFWVLILNWWVFFQNREFEAWSFEVFLVVIVWAVLYFLLAVLLFPPDVLVSEDYSELFERNRKWFLSVFVASTFADVLLTASRGDLLDPPEYLPFALHLVLLGVLGIFIESRRFQVGLAGWVVGVSLVWSLGIRRFLAG